VETLHSLSHFFPVAGVRIWNTLPLHVTSASSLTVFKQRLILHLFCFSFPGLSPVRLGWVGRLV